MMVLQMNFSKFINIYGNYRSLFINRSAITNCTQVAALRLESRQKLKMLPERPKKPATSFFLFARERREEMKKSHPHLKTPEISKILSKEWSDLDATSKEKYVTQYINSMKSYLQKHLVYNSNLTEEEKHIIKEIDKEKAQAKKTKTLKKTLKELNKPKRPKGAFIYFALEYYEKEKAAGVKFRDFLKKSKPMWDNLPAGEKQKFNLMYSIDKKRYNLEMEKWEEEMVKLGHEDLVRQNTVTHYTTPIRPIRQRYQEEPSSQSEESSKNSSK